jgi:hypothetical protein
MKVAVAHLSDIHIRSHSDALLSQCSALAAVIAAESTGAGHLFVAITGDIAWSGQASEYAAIEPMLVELRQRLSKELRCAVDFVVCPGNHDCNFQLDNATRRHLVASLSAADAPEIDESVISQCTRVQQPFFEFRERLESRAAGFDDQLWRTQVFEIGSLTVAFESLNLSWLSQLPESPGRLSFPVDRFADMPRSSADLRIALLHHPFNWLSQSSYRPLRDLVRRISDIVLTGHEHVGVVGIHEDSAAGQSVFVEGCVLQEHGSSLDSSALNVISIDVSTRKFRSVRCAWDGERFRPTPDGSWTDYRQFLLRRDAVAALDPHFVETLDDIGGPISHPGRATVTLEDLFVYPDLLEFSDKPHQRLYKSSAFLASPEAVSDGVLLEGDEKSGKTSLLRHLFRVHYEREFYPVLIAGRLFNRDDASGVRRVIEAAIRSQYGESRFEEVRQAPRAKRVAMIDDLDEAKIKSSSGCSQILRHVRELFAHVIVTSGQTFEIDQADPSQNQELLSLKRFQVQPFGYALRSKLIAKWHALGADGTLDESTVLARCDQSEKLINYVMKRGLIPSVPLFLLTLLQSIEVGRSGEFKHSALGFYYQFLLTDSFARSGVNAEQLTELFQYCSHLAWFFHLKGSDAVGESELRVFNDQFSSEWHTVDLGERLSTLVKSHVLCLEGGEYRFRYPYIYYFLKGQYVSERLKDEEFRAYVQHCCEHLYVRDHAHTVLFLAHHTTDPFVLSSIQATLRKLFGSHQPITFAGDTGGIAKLMDDVPKLAFQGGRPEEHRERRNRLRDEIEVNQRDGLHDREEVSPELSLPAKLTSLIKTTEILGQVLKNQYSKITRKRKEELLNEVFSGPLRALRDFYGHLEAHPDALRIAVESALDHLPQKLDKVSVEKIARRLTASIVLAISYGFVARAAESANASSLAENVEQVVDANGSTAYRLIDLAIALDSAGGLPRAKLKKVARLVSEEPIALRVFQLIVLNRLYMFRTSEKDLQWLATDFNLDIVHIHKIAYSSSKGRLLR